MQVNTNIDEADVGKLKDGMPASFSVDAYNGVTFIGTIGQIRLAATTVQNVVTYDAIVNVANEDLRLKPGMTANVKIVVEKADGVLKIPNSALRYKPNLTEADMEKVFKKAGEAAFWVAYEEGLKAQAQAMNAVTGGQNMGSRNGIGGVPALVRQRSTADMKLLARGQSVPLWTLGEDQSLRPMVVKLGLTDGVSTQVLEGKLKAGDRIVVGLEFDPSHSASSTQLPLFGGARGGGSVRSR